MVITIDEHNQEFYSEVMNRQLEIGDVISRSECEHKVTYTKVAQDSKDTETI